MEKNSRKLNGVDFKLQCSKGVSQKGMHYEDIHVEGMDLHEANLENVCITNSIFKECNFSRCSLFLADLKKVKFINCKLIGIDCRSMIGDEVEFENCSLNEADFSGANLSELEVYECVGKVDFYRTRIDLGSFICGDFPKSNFKGAELDKVHFQECDLESCEIDVGTELVQTTFTSCRLTDTNLKKAGVYTEGGLLNCTMFPFKRDDLTNFALIDKNIQVDMGWEDSTPSNSMTYGWYPKKLVEPKYKTDFKAYLYCSNLKLYRNRK